MSYSLQLATRERGGVRSTSKQHETTRGEAATNDSGRPPQHLV
jgi:hypothetical protein